MTSRDPDDIVRLVTAPNPVQAHILEQALLDEGIEAKVVGDYLNAGIGGVPGLTPEVWVHRNDVAAGEEVLRRSREAELAPGAEDAE